MDSNLKTSIKNKLKTIFGVGPKGVIISLLLFSLFFWINSFIEFQITGNMSFIKIVGVILIITGLGLHIWSFFTLRNWWTDDMLCINGPFKYFRHPMYAAWISFLCPGLALYLNSWMYLLWVLMLHLLWNNIVKLEEIKMTDTFGDVYKNYAKRTGRFFPRMLH